MQDEKRYACLLIDRHKPGVYSTLHLLDQRWWDWLHQPAPDTLRLRPWVEVPLPAGTRTEDGLDVCRSSARSFRNDLMHAAVSALHQEDVEIALPGLDGQVSEEVVRSAAYYVCAERGIDASGILEGLWY